MAGLRYGAIHVDIAYSQAIGSTHIEMRANLQQRVYIRIANNLCALLTPAPVWRILFPLS